MPSPLSMKSDEERKAEQRALVAATKTITLFRVLGTQVDTKSPIQAWRGVDFPSSQTPLIQGEFPIVNYVHTAPGGRPQVMVARVPGAVRGALLQQRVKVQLYTPPKDNELHLKS